MSRIVNDEEIAQFLKTVMRMRPEGGTTEQMMYRIALETLQRWESYRYSTLQAD